MHDVIVLSMTVDFRAIYLVLYTDCKSRQKWEYWFLWKWLWDIKRPHPAVSERTRS